MKPILHCYSCGVRTEFTPDNPHRNCRDWIAFSQVAPETACEIMARNQTARRLASEEKAKQINAHDELVEAATDARNALDVFQHEDADYLNDVALVSDLIGKLEAALALAKALKPQ